jgi:UDP-glucose 4-epimerase
MIKILLTGADGYIGNCFYQLYKKKYIILPIDKSKLHNKHIVICNLIDKNKLSKIFEKFKPDVIVHLAAQSLVNDKIPFKKYKINNIDATKNLVNVMKKNNFNNIIFSSTAAVYASSDKPLSEKSKLKPLSHYAKSKLKCEKIIRKSKLNNIIFRFFNACSAVKKVNAGELHKPETHLIPKIVWQIEHNKSVKIYGKNHKTKDGTPIRDYIHVSDICNAINLFVSEIFKNNESHLVNVGTAKGFTVMEMIRYLSKIRKKKINVRYLEPRKNEAARLICDNKKIFKTIKWKPIKSTLNQIFKDEIYWVRYLKKTGEKRFLSDS